MELEGEFLSFCYVKSLENLSEHTKPLLPLNCGNHVMKQSQTNNFPIKWGKSGVVVELKDYHKYSSLMDHVA